ncbi:molybdopterin-dependent oxidoreductase [Alcanivorax sp. JB21]|uniref:nitrate reductase n=1 Tax=Alcanivorax limicola TaxID=2874102 RepID=UPI001CBCB839|nr:nitrate reductase [Alcanivorax limicola]MBZ2187786.1 molybdopterin-dependent oxidoreductase [Alcanivorax limicola]
MSRCGDQDTTQTTCPYCGVGCGVAMQRTQDDGWKASGLAAHPANQGRLCVKGSALGDTVSVRERLLYPEINECRVSWDQALDTVAVRMREAIDQYGPESIGFYVSGQLLTEDYYVANKLMKGFIGAANIDTNSRLCMASAVVAHKKTLGADAVPGCYADLELADLVIITGSNMAWTHPVVYQRIVAAKQQRPDMKVVVIDPRETATCDLADLHLAIQPGSDGFLFTALLAWMADQGNLDQDFIAAHTRDAEAAIAAAAAAFAGSADDVAGMAEACGVSTTALSTFFDWFAQSPKTVTVFSQGINQSETGVDKASAIINCHLATGRIGKPGAAPFSITGQPNAMGGREVGGLANQLAAHMGFDEPSRSLVGRFWGSNRVARAPGFKAVDLFRAVGEGRIKVIWIMATNPVVSMPEADLVRAALAQCPTVIVSDCVADTDTLRMAHIRLPAAGWGEKDGTVTNSERCISRQRAFLPLPGEARPDWWIISALAQRLGFSDAFDYANPAAIFREHAALSGFEQSRSRRAFDIGALATLSDRDYDSLLPVQWPLSAHGPGDPGSSGTERLFADGHFFTPDGRARLVPVTPRLSHAGVNSDWPLLLNSGRLRDQWHTMTRTGRAQKLLSHTSEPFVAMHPEDMKRADVREGDLVRVESPLGQCVVPACSSDGQQQGSVFMPIHWNDCFASAARVDALVAANCDAESGQPAFKQTPVRVAPFAPIWHATVIALTRLNAPDASHYWCRIPGEPATRLRMAGQRPVDTDWLRARCPDVQDWAEMTDEASGHHRLLGYRQGKPVCFAVISPLPADIDEDWLALALAEPRPDPMQLMAGVPGGLRDNSAVVCSCYQIRQAKIEEAIHEGCADVAAISRCTGAGSGCGSCIPELKKLLAAGAGAPSRESDEENDNVEPVRALG